MVVSRGFDPIPPPLELLLQQITFDYAPVRSFIRYDWTKVATPVSDEDKALVTEMWCSETTVEGRPVLDGKVFK